MQDAQGLNWLIRLYYTRRVFMGVCCVSCEVLYLACFLSSHPLAPAVMSPAPLWLLRAVAAVTGAAAPRADLLVSLVLCATLPGFLIKQVVNVHQGQAAMRRLVELDAAKAQ